MDMPMGLSRSSRWKSMEADEKDYPDMARGRLFLYSLAHNLVLLRSCIQHSSSSTEIRT